MFAPEYVDGMVEHVQLKVIEFFLGADRVKKVTPVVGVLMKSWYHSNDLDKSIAETRRSVVIA
ncbi:MAG: hypothetical protein DME22_16410 [Verrucomicrobia bacterium]|nr:MAG: hypothetical protein DME22_16410 [Verrucomicrobiota bacterium]